MPLIVWRLEQSKNAYSLIYLKTELIVISLSDVQPTNAYLPIVLIIDKSIVSSDVHAWNMNGGNV